MHSHTYVHSLTFNSRVLSLKCSPRLVVVALDAQIHAFDAATLQHTFSAVTYSVSAALQTVKADSYQTGAMAPIALGSAWLAYASNQASQSFYAICYPTCHVHDGTHQAKVHHSAECHKAHASPLNTVEQTLHDWTISRPHDF